MQMKVHLRKWWGFFIFYILATLLFFIIHEGLNWFLLLLFLIIISLFLFLFYWQIFLFPQFGLLDQLRLSKSVILKQLFNKQICLSVKDGEIVGEYGLLKIKPFFPLLNIDHTSAVLLEDDKKHKFLLFNGFHILRNNPKIIGTFSLGFRHIHLGPVDQYSFSKQKSQESLTAYHSRISQVERTKTQLNSGALIYPSLSIFYRLEITDIPANEFFEILSRIALFKEAGSLPVSPIQFESFLVNRILKNWVYFSKSTEVEKLLSAFPGKFTLMDEILKGLLLEVFVDNIFSCKTEY
jgi:hypothetical protein